MYIFLLFFMLFSILNWNVRGVMSSNVCLTNLLRLTKCDVAVISEHKLPENCSKFLNSIDKGYISTATFEKSLKNGDIGKGGVAILYKRSLEFYTSLINTNSNRVIGICLKTPTHVPLYIFGVYLPSENDVDKYREELNVLHDLYTIYSNHGHVIFAGDMNGSLQQKDVEKTNSYKSAELVTFYRKNNLHFPFYNVEQCKDVYTFIPCKTMLDYTFFSESLKNHLVDYDIIPEGVISNTSDHLPVIAKIEIVENPLILLPNTTKWPAWHRICADSKKSYCNQLQTELNQHLPPEKNEMSLNEIDVYTTTIINAVIKSADLTIPTCSYNPHTKPYWNTTVKEAHKSEMESRINWIQEGKPRGMQHPSYAKYKRAKRHFRQCQESASEEYMKKTYEDIDNAAGIDIRLFWKLICRQKPRQSKIYPEIQFADRTGNTPESVASVFAEYFSTIYQTEQNDTFDTDFYNSIINEYDNIKSQETQNSIFCSDDRITEKEVLDSISLLKSKKAPGPDKIQSEHLMHGKDVLSKYLCVLFNSILNLGQIPSGWKQGFIVPIYKGGNKPKTSPDSYRPISLLSTLFKVFEKIIHARIMDNLSNEKSFPNPQQQGFRKSLSSITAAFNLQETILHYIENGSSVYTCFLDSRKAFDTVWRKGLLYKLNNIGIKGKLWMLIDDCHINTKSAVIVNYQQSEWFPVEQGIRQGGVLSGFLYTVFIDDLLNELERINENFGIHKIKSSTPALADDIACLSSNPNSLQNMLNTAYNYSCRWRFSFNAGKSCIIVFGKNPKPDFSHQWLIGNKSIPIQKDYNHLGIIQNCNFKSITRTKEACDKGRRSYYAIKNLSSGNSNPVTLVNLYKKVVLPSIDLHFMAVKSGMNLNCRIISY